MPERISTTLIKKARKQHICDDCGGHINIGESYISNFYKNDGEVYKWKEHVYCKKVGSVLFSSGFFEDHNDGMDNQAYEDCVRELHDVFLALESNLSVQDMSKNLAEIFKTKDLKAYMPRGYVEKWVLVEKQDWSGCIVGIDLAHGPDMTGGL